MNSSNAEVRSIDFAKYRTPELVDQIVDLISIPKASLKLILGAAVGGVLAFGLFATMFLFSGLSWWVWLLGMLLTGFVGAALGCSLMLIWIIGGGLRNVGSILQISLDMTNQVACDIQELRRGDANLPSGRELAGQVYLQVIEPSLESAARRAFSILATPAIVIYRWSIGAALKRALKNTKPAPGDPSPTNKKPARPITKCGSNGGCGMAAQH